VRLPRPIEERKQNGLLFMEERIEIFSGSNRCHASDARLPANDQLTDGGPSVALGLPSDAAGPPLGEAPGSVIFAAIDLRRPSRDPSST